MHRSLRRWRACAEVDACDAAPAPPWLLSLFTDTNCIETQTDVAFIISGLPGGRAEALLQSIGGR
jgi:hypothetical protein